MSEPDWKTAPEGATHYSKRTAAFYKFVDGDLFCFVNRGNNGWEVSDYTNNEDFIYTLNPRPSPAWHETGDLPPIGTECEFSVNTTKTRWCKVYMIGLSRNGAPVFEYEDGTVGNLADNFLPEKGSFFRPIQSDRDKFVDDALSMCTFYEVENDIIGTYRKAFEQMYEAGFRKPDQDLKSQLETSEMWKGALVEVVNDLLESSNYFSTNGEIKNSLYLARNKARELLIQLLDSMEQK